MEPLKSLVLIDETVENYQQLMAGVQAGIEAILLDSHQDGVAQITKILSNNKKIAGLHIISHGSAGTLQLGNRILDLQALQNPQIQADLKQWKTALAPRSEILLYGCEIAAGILGKTFVNQLSRLTGASIAASETKTGNAALGGNWQLEYQAGQIQSYLPFQTSALEAYQGILIIERIRIAGDGSQSNNNSISADGRYVVFDSIASNLVAGDTNGTGDVFVYDRETGQTRRVSVASDGTQSNGYSYKSSFSADGRYVVFDSGASNLVAGDTNGNTDVFVHDLQTGQTSWVSVASDGTQRYSHSYSCSISADGRYVVFEYWSWGSTGGTGGRENNVFIHDLQTGQTSQISVASDSSQSYGFSSNCSISADGRYVVFNSGARNLVAGDTNGSSDVFVHDLQTDQTNRVSVASDGTQSNNHSFSPSFSADGRYVVFESEASNLVAGDTNGEKDVFVYDRQTGQTRRVSVTSDGSQSNDSSSNCSISADGRYVVFDSWASNLVAGDTNGSSDVFVHDRQTGQTHLLAVANDGTEGNGGSYSPSISADGRYVVFDSYASNLVAWDTNECSDIFVQSLDNLASIISVGNRVWYDANLNGIQDTWENGFSSSMVTVQLYNSSNTLVASTSTSAEGLYYFYNLSAGDYYIKFIAPKDYFFTTQNAASNDILDSDVNVTTGQTALFSLDAGKDDPSWDAGLFFTGVVRNERVSIASDGTQANGNSSYNLSISADGRYVVFESEASNLVAGDTNGEKDVFVHDRETGQTSRISVASDGSQANGNSSYNLSISADGRYVVFESEASNLVAGDTNGEKDVFVHDRETGQTSRISVASDGSQNNTDSYNGSISADGRYVVFTSWASNLVPGDTNGFGDIFVHDLQTGQTTLVSIASDGSQSNGFSYNFSISADGRYVTFYSDASNLVPGDTNGFYDIFVHDLQIGQTSRVSVASDGSQSNNDSHGGSISADGRYVTFSSDASNLVPGDTNGFYDIFVHDLQTGQTTRVSIASDGSQGNQTSYSTSISADGRYVTFHSEASNLVPGDTNGSSDIFVHDRETGETSLVSSAIGDTQSNNSSYFASISADGQTVAFWSQASNLIPDDTNGISDIFVHTLGIPTTASVGNKVWNDTNVNGIQDAGETGISGITVQLYDTSNTLVASTTTNFEGLYSFDEISAGDYSLKFVALEGYTFTTQDAGTDDTLDSDVDVTTGQTAVFTLKGGDNIVNWDAGIYQSSSFDNNIELVNVIPEQGSISSWHKYNPASLSISADGRYLSFSISPNIGDPNNIPAAIFVQDLLSDTTISLPKYSILSGITSLNDGFKCSNSSLSGDGRYVAFESFPTRGDGPHGGSWDEWVQGQHPDIVVYDQFSQITTVMASGNDPSISTDGRYIAYTQFYYDWWMGHIITEGPIHIYDQQTHTNKTLSINLNGVSHDCMGGEPSISANSRYISFSSTDNQLVAGDTNGQSDIFVYDQQTGLVERVSVASNGTQTNLGQGSRSPSISADGRYVAFASDASNLVEADTNGTEDIFVHDRQTHTTARVSVASDGTQLNQSSSAPSISADGGYVTFTSSTGNNKDIFVHDRQTGMTRRVSVATDGAQSNDSSFNPVISADGRSVAFTSDASNLVTGDTNDRSDVFVYTTDLTLPRTPTIGNFVWNDLNKNGLQDPGEEGMAGVTVELYNASNTLITSQTTGIGGFYRFSDLSSGDYSLKFVAPEGYTFTTPDAGEQDILDSDVDVTTGQTPVFTFNMEEKVEGNWDAGLYITPDDGTDTTPGGGGTDTTPGGGTDTIPGGGTDTIPGDQTSMINGTASSDTLFGTPSADTINGLTGHDWIFALSSNDTILGGADNDLIFGNRGNDSIDAGTGNDWVFAGKDHDTVFGADGQDFLFGNQGNDSLVGGEGDDYLNGNAGNDTLDGNAGHDTLHGGKDSDVLLGNAGNDLLCGDFGNDSLTGGDGNDYLNGNSGQDSLDGGIGNDTLHGGKDHDRLDGNTGNDLLCGNLGNDTLIGGDGNDYLNGNSGQDSLDGNAGNDTLYGGKGNDWLNGNAGNDWLIGNTGDDTLIGGDGKDYFVYNTGTAFKTADIGLDRINDFVSGVDQIILSQTTLTALTSIQSELATVTTNAAVGISKALIVYNSATGGLFYNENGIEAGFGSGGLFAILTTMPAISAGDFLLVA